MTRSRPPSDRLLPAVAAVVAGRPPALSGVAVEPLVRRLERLGVAGLAVADARARRGEGDRDPAVERLVDALLPTYHRVGLHTALVLESAQRALDVLAEARVEALLFKGAALYRTGVYRDPGARPLEDADVLVPAEDAERAVAALSRAGFAPWEAWSPGRAFWASSFSFSDTTAPGGVAPAIDLHWATPYVRLRQTGPWGRDPLWDGACDGVPSPEAHLAVLAEHVLKHLRVVVHVRGLADLARSVLPVGDGDLLRRQAEGRGSLPGLRIVLAFLRDVLRVELPPGVARAVGVPGRVPARARARLRPERVFAAGPPRGSRTGGVLGDWWLIGSARDSLAEVGRVLLPSALWLRSRYEGPGALAGKRLRYTKDLASWMLGVGPSPLSPNQGIEA